MRATILLRTVACAACLSVSITLIAGFSAPESISAQDTDDGLVVGRSLEKTCASSETFDAGLCLGYINGVVDASEYLSRATCATQDGVTRGQIRSVVKKWLADHPEKLHEVSVKSIRAAMLAFCKK